ncbi:hypothetical protein FDP08_17120 [Marinobacter panjinensis]|uniref:Co-chaperone DjlA N-terminal domain-containing protein n=1 Tax=Marinobacter panjinensis TaxID=2576384 RepID=A0A4U6QTZ4_9GAMM|nr:hypothetical protein [Marinobacter panjinensis]MCR8914895.1 hypothetical protein [Marinobacter panjinensis]TKV64139.1 hypothetical protein FDP08_17120 [Marinobacter panjinensis]
MDSLLASEAFEFGLGAFFVIFHAYGRFNTPVSNRSSTTRWRFNGCFVLYSGALVLIYWLVTFFAWVSPEVVDRILPLLGWPAGSEMEGGDLFRSPLTIALIFTALLPNFPVLKKVDHKLLQIFWDLAEIPGHAVKLAHQMYRAPYHIFPMKFDEMERDAKAFDIPANRGELTDDHASPAFAWATAWSLINEVRHWHEGRSRYHRFIQEREGEYEALSMEFTTLSSRIAAYYRRLEELGGRPQRIEKDLRDSLVSDGRDLFMRLCRLLAHAVLDIEIGPGARRRALETFGFEVPDDEPESLGMAKLLQVVAIAMAAFMAVSFIRYTIEGGNGAPFGTVVFFALLMGANFGVSAHAGTFPKSRWRFADIEANRSRPWSGYVFSGVLAVGASLVVISALRFTRYVFDGKTYQAGFDQLVVDLSWSFPYLFLSFAIGFGVAWVCDTEWRRWPARYRRWLDALALGIIGVVGAYICYSAMHGFPPFEGTKAPQFRDASVAGVVQFIVQSTVAAALIGALVPGWYRQNRYRSPVQRVCRYIDRNSHDLRIEAGKLAPFMLKNLLTKVAASSAMADGLLDHAERDVLRDTLNKMAEHNLLDFTVDAGMEEMMQQVERWREEDAEELRNEMLQALQMLRGSEYLAGLMVQLSAATGYADGVFQVPEQYILECIARALNLDPQSELAACSLCRGWVGPGPGVTVQAASRTDSGSPMV